jgi:hypothetical protein
MSVDIAAWEMQLRSDHRLNGKARQVAHVLAEHFCNNDGHCQMSAERVASAAGIISVTATRDALAALRISGWLASTRVDNTQRHGMEHRPTMASTGA